jgi:hypothetical protein
MPPPKKILFYYLSVIPSEKLQYKTLPPASVVHFFSSPHFIFSSPLCLC